MVQWHHWWFLSEVIGSWPFKCNTNISAIFSFQVNDSQNSWSSTAHIHMSSINESNYAAENESQALISYRNISTTVSSIGSKVPKRAGFLLDSLMDTFQLFKCLALFQLNCYSCGKVIHSPSLLANFTVETFTKI